MTNKLFTLFDDLNDLEKDLLASEPQTMESFSSVESDQDYFIKKSKYLDAVEPKVDYSDFSNFVSFNSALDYFQITAEKILNEYPAGGSRIDLENFKQDLDGYEKHVLSQWPKRIGHLRFNPSISASYISVEDVGVENGVMKSSFLNPNTGSFSIEAWYKSAGHITGSNAAQIIVQKLDQSNNGYTVYLSGSQIYFKVVSGSSTNEVSAVATGSDSRYFCAVCDRSSLTGTISLITGSSVEFPVVVSSASLGFYSTLNLASSSFYIGSGTLSGKTIEYFTGSLDDVRFWKKPRTINELSSSFNTKIYAQNDLVALWRFNESGSIASNNSLNRLVIDSSGHGINGRIQNYFNGIRGSGSLIFDEPDPILFIESPEVLSYVTIQQASASLYDRENSAKITDLMPEAFFTLEAENEVLKNFLYVIARQFDEIKLRIDQFVNLLRVNYGNFDQTPDAVLNIAAKFFGFEFTGNFLNADAFQYILGKNVLQNLSSNEDLDIKLYEIKNEFWRRSLNNLTYLYKSKGTKESVQSLLRNYGVNDNFVKIKEYAYSKESALSTQRIHAEKSSYSLAFGSGSITGSLYRELSGQLQLTGSYTIETRVRFPLTSSSGLTATVISGSIWTKNSGSAAADSIIRLSYHKDSLGSHTGSLILSASDFYVPIYNANIFDNKWYNIAVIRDSLSGTFKVDVKNVDDGEIVKEYSAVSGNIFNGQSVSGSYTTLTFGYSGSMKSEFYGQEFRVWARALTNDEISDHALNYQSYGLMTPLENSDLRLHWRLAENITGSVDGQLSLRIEDISGNSFHGSSRGWSTINPYKKFLNEYDFIASPDLGWTEQKIRIFNGSNTRQSDRYIDNNVIALEFNMVDALNEDITQLMSSLDELNQSISLGANKYRDSYDGLKRLRTVYFKRLQGRLNFRVFSDFLEFFDRSFIDMVKRLIPARAQFIGDEFVVESHMLERPKVQYNKLFRQEQAIELEGRIKGHSRFGRNTDKSGTEFPLNLPGARVITPDPGMRFNNCIVYFVGNNRNNGVIKSSVGLDITPATILSGSGR